MRKYGFSFFWSEEDGGYIATCPDFPGLSAFGETIEEATLQANSALDGFIEILKSDGIPLPKPTTLPEYSGQLRLRLPFSLHRELTERAKMEGTSLNSYIVYQLSERNATISLAKEVLQRIDVFESKVTSHMRIIGKNKVEIPTSYVPGLIEIRENLHGKIFYNVGEWS